MIPKPIVISKDFYSNCFIEAIKAKIMNWKKHRVLCIPKRINHESNCHYVWIDKETEKIYEFVSDKQLNFFETLFYKGHIQEIPAERHSILMEKYLNSVIDKYVDKLEIKYAFKSGHSKNKDFIRKSGWRTVGFDELPTVEDLDDSKSFIGKVDGKIVLLQLDNTNKIIGLENPDLLEMWKPI